MAGSTRRPEQLLAVVRTARAQQGVLDDGGRRVGPPGCGPDARPWCWGQRKRVGSTSPSLGSSSAKSSTGRPWIMWSCQKQKEPPVPPPRIWWNRAADASPGRALPHRKPSSTRRCWTVSGVAARDWRTQDSARTLPCKCPWGCSMLPGDQGDGPQRHRIDGVVAVSTTSSRWNSPFPPFPPSPRTKTGWSARRSLLSPNGSKTVPPPRARARGPLPAHRPGIN